MTTFSDKLQLTSHESARLPRPFILRRLHSLLGLWLVIYLFEHLLVNSQMALFFEDNGSGFVRMVNKIHALPYLKAIELLFLGVPFLIHGGWGVVYVWRGKLNSYRTDGTRPALPQYPRNQAYSWQRITSWLLLVGIIAHVVHMRFVEYPTHIWQGEEKLYFSHLSYQPALPYVAQKLSVTLYNQAQIQQLVAQLKQNQNRLRTMQQPADGFVADDPYYALFNQVSDQEKWIRAAQSKPLKSDEVLAVAPSAGAAFFLIVRQAFMYPMVVILYSLLVIAATYHAFNGLWTFMISWGITLTFRSQKVMRTLTTILMAVVMFLGLMSAWGTYWMNLLESV